MVESGKLVRVDYEARVDNEVLEQRKAVVPVGKGYVVKGFDEALEKAEVGKEVTVTVLPEKAYGSRNQELVRLVPMEVFRRQGIDPAVGLPIELDGMPCRVQSVSGGRVRVDFNNDLAGRTLVYKFTVLEELVSTLDKITGIATDYLPGVVKCSFDEKSKTAVIDVDPDAALKGGYLQGKGRAVSMILTYVDEVSTVRVSEEFTKQSVGKS